MIQIEKDKYIKCAFKNGTFIEGIVQLWTKEEAVLQSYDGSSMIIAHPEKDILFVKVMLHRPKEESMRPVEEIKGDISNKLKEIQSDPDAPPDLQNKSISELRKMVVDQDKQIMVNKIRTHFAGGVPKNNYATPFGTKQPTNSARPGQ
jgi:hypothetical protein